MAHDNLDLSNEDVFEYDGSSTPQKAWREGDDLPTCTRGPGVSDYLQATSQFGTTVTAANVHEGISWNGNVALTSPERNSPMTNGKATA